MVVNFQKGLPLSENAKAILSEEEQQEVLDNAGKWVISSLALYKNGNSNYDYEKKLSSIIDEIPADTILVGGLPIFQDVVALIPNSDGVIEEIVPVTATAYDENLVTYARSNSVIYDYEQEIKEKFANDLPEANSDMLAEQMLKMLIILKYLCSVYLGDISFVSIWLCIFLFQEEKQILKQILFDGGHVI